MSWKRITSSPKASRLTAEGLFGSAARRTTFSTSFTYINKSQVSPRSLPSRGFFVDYPPDSRLCLESQDSHLEGVHMRSLIVVFPVSGIAAVDAFTIQNQERFRIICRVRSLACFGFAQKVANLICFLCGLCVSLRLSALKGPLTQRTQRYAEGRRGKTSISTRFFVQSPFCLFVDDSAASRP